MNSHRTTTTTTTPHQWNCQLTVDFRTTCLGALPVICKTTFSLCAKKSSYAKRSMFWLLEWDQQTRSKELDTVYTIKRDRGKHLGGRWKDTETLEAIHLETDVESRTDTYTQIHRVGNARVHAHERLSNACKFIVKSVTLWHAAFKIDSKIDFVLNQSYC